MSSCSDWPLAEVISIKDCETKKQFYVHYIDYNKRLDEWVDEDRLDTRKIQYPRRDLASGTTTGLNTPKKTLTGTTNSRPSSPGLTPAQDPITGPSVLAALQQKQQKNRKRKLDQSEVRYHQLGCPFTCCVIEGTPIIWVLKVAPTVHRGNICHFNLIQRDHLYFLCISVV
ncbi:putative histone acetyltransferase Tip60 isoform X2 [Penaeus vannamei]|uniref:histone acetyltransferase n=1 Tax=Penaeus vannamei TaxID=6689 RepID=A0A3R7MMV1_PENVA|nr:putative histone acetyltransferase Tip60 isoform X2 [Penaeus vannamei]